MTELATFRETNRSSLDSMSSDSSIALDHLNDEGLAFVKGQEAHLADDLSQISLDKYDHRHSVSHSRAKSKTLMWIGGVLCFGGWLIALLLFITRQTYKHPSTKPYDPHSMTSKGSGKVVSLDQLFSGAWSVQRHELVWTDGPNGEDGFLLGRTPGIDSDFLFIEDIRARQPDTPFSPQKTLMKEGYFEFDGKIVIAEDAWPCKTMSKILVISDKKQNWRHSFTGLYWIFDVQTQSVEPLDPDRPDERIQLASWSPKSDSIVFTRHNNMFLRKLSDKSVVPITSDGGPQVFYGVPDWVYEEEVYAGNSVTWWADSADFIAFLRINETSVPEYPIQYFASRPSGKTPPPELLSYPEVRKLKYPKAGAPNPIANIQFYDVAKNEIFTIPITDDFINEDRLITEVIWAGSTGQILVKNTNRESDVLKVSLLDVNKRTGKVVRVRDIKSIDGGWFEVSERTTFVPQDLENGRPNDGYLDTVIHDGYDHLAYFSPLDSSEPLMLTTGSWEVVDAPSAVDLAANIVYFIGTKQSSLERHVYGVNLNGTGFQHVSDGEKEGYYGASFSSQAGFALLSYAGPGIPWEELRTTPGHNSKPWQYKFEENKNLAKLAAETELPIQIFSTITVDGVELNVVERRPAHFDERKRYPVLFQVYGGPGSQQVDKRFKTDFQTYVASSLEYIVVTVDGRGTGFIGRAARTLIRDHIGYYEGLDQIYAAQIWAKKDYVDEDRIAIWGWSYGGFMTLKSLELDAGATFKYGMAVAPVTDWKFYDSIYTERYMRTPQDNPAGYMNTSISEVDRLSKCERFLIMHGVADDNVHLQNTLTLLDKLDIAGIENYDVHIFPDSDHNIMFHNAYRMVYDRLSNWLISAFGGEFINERLEPTSPIVS